MYRNFRLIATGVWLNVVMTVADGTFSVTPDVHRAEIALGFGLPAQQIEVVDGLVDARAGVLLEPVPQPPRPPTPEQVTWQTAATVAQKLAIVGRRLGLEG